MWSISRRLALLIALSVFALAQNPINLDTGVKGSRLPMWGVDSGSANAYVLTTSAVLGPTLRTGSHFVFVAAHTNTTSSTANVDSTGAITIKKFSAGTLSNLAAGDITALQVVIIWYDGTQYQCVTCGSGSGGAGGGSALSALNQTGQTATYTNSTWYSAPSSGLYRVGWYAKLTSTSAGSISFVQGQNAAGGVCTFSSNVTGGNLLVIAVRQFSGTVTSVTGNANTFHAAGSAYTDSTGNSVQLWYAWNANSGSTPITATITGSFAHTACAEYSGALNGSDPLDRTAGSNGTSNAPASGNITTTSAAEIVIGFANSHNGTTWTAGTGFTLRENEIGVGLEDKTLSATSTLQATFSASTTDAWSCGIASFIAGAGGTSSLQTTISWTDADDNTSMSFVGSNLNANSVTAVDQEQVIVNAKSGTNIGISTAYASTGGAAYSLHAEIAQP